MPLFRIQQNVMTGQGESITIDLCQWNPVTGEVLDASVESMQQAMQEMSSIADNRMFELNMRMLNVQHRVRDYFEPHIWAMIVQLLDVFAGRIDMDTLLKRWDSVKEENAELALQRDIYAQGQHEDHEDVKLLDLQRSDSGLIAPCGCSVDLEGEVHLCSTHLANPFA